MNISETQYVLIVLLIKLGIIASIATILVRFKFFKNILRYNSSFKNKLPIVITMGIIFSLGILARILVNYSACDLALEGSLLSGILLGTLPGQIVGLIVGVTALLNNEYFAPILYIIAGSMGGLIYKIEPRMQNRLDFSPLFILELYKFSKQLIRDKGFNKNIITFLFCLFLETVRSLISKNYGHLYGIVPADFVMYLLIFFTTLSSVGIPLKIWKNTLVEMVLTEHESNLFKTKLEALESRINPHFLFNTLNTIYSTIRIDTNLARKVVLKLSDILRFVLRTKDNFVTLKDELDILESYIDIERIRFGNNNVKFIKRIGSNLENLVIPKMLLQPLIENSIKHGISENDVNGEIRLTIKSSANKIHIELSDNGCGIEPNVIPNVKNAGIGISNIDQRLKILYGDEYTFDIMTRPKGGTLIKMVIPKMQHMTLL